MLITPRIGYNLKPDMPAKFKTIRKPFRVFSLIVSAVLITACNSTSANLPKESEAAAAASEKTLNTNAFEAEPTAQPVSRPTFGLPDNLVVFSPDNLQNIHELASVYPYFPSYYHISNDGSRIAIGDMQKIEIRDAASGKVLSSIPASLPECDFGFDRYFRLNANGSFIALLNGQSIQVWQVGGGLIYDSPLFNGFTSNAPSCGADLPELVLSPDGRLLAFSGMVYSHTSVKRYFRVVDILANEVLYEWDGRDDALHGYLYTFYGLGFSDDNRFLQTFDPLRFIRSEGNVYQAFRFWSVNDWHEVQRSSSLLEESFNPGQLLFSLADSGVLEIRSKLTGLKSSEITINGCLWDAPCETRFSEDGKYAAIINRADGNILFKNESLHSAISVWDLKGNKEIKREFGEFRDLESIIVQDDVQILRADQIDGKAATTSGWWTFSDHFFGLLAAGDGKISFTPLSATSINTQDCQFCATCTVDSGKGEIDCANGLIDSEGERIYLKTVNGKQILARQNETGEAILGEIALPAVMDPTKLRVRLLGYSMPHQTLFYCTNENSRPSGCFIYDPYRKEIIAEPEDISYLRFSPDGKKAAFYNRTVNALYLYDLSSKNLSRKSPYRARGFPINPVFSADGTKFFYIIQNQDNTSDLSVETLDAITWKSYERVSLKKAGIEEPTVFTESRDGAVWAIAGKSGEVWLLSPDKGVLLHRFQAHLDDIIGMEVSLDNKWLLTMGENGILKFWGIEQ